MASNYDGNKGVNGNGLLYFIGKVKTWIDTYFLKKNLGSSKASKVVVTDSSGNVDVSTITTTELGYLSGMNQKIVTALNAKANQTDFLDLGNGFQTFVNTTAPATYQKKMTIGGGTEGAVTTISAGLNTSITIDGTTATIASTDTKMSNKSYTAGTDTKVVVGTKITGNNTLADTQKTLTAGSGISITGTTSAITIANTYTLPMANENTLGGIKVFDPFYTDDGLLCLNYDSSLYVNDLGNLAVSQSSDSVLGGVKVAGVVTGSDQQGLNYVVKIASGGTDNGKLGIETASTSHAGVMSPTMVTTLNNALPASAVKNTEQSGSAASANNVYRCDYINTAMGSKAPLASPALTGTPTAPTAATSTNTTQIATTAFVHAAIENADIGGKTYQGNIDAESALKDIKTFKQGQYFTVSSAFTFADGSWALGIGDMLFVKENYTWASGNVDGSKFAAVQGNNDYLTNKELDAIFTEVFGSAA